MSARTTMNGKPVYTVPAKTVLNWDSAFRHKLLCTGPTFSAGTACAYSCEFCFVPSAMRKSPHFAGIKEPFEDVVIRRENALALLRRQLDSSKGKEESKNPHTIYASPLVDVAANMDLVRETIEMCVEILERTVWDIRLLSKSNLLPKIAGAIAVQNPEWTPRMIFGVSTGTLDDNVARAIEGGTPLVSKRLESLHWLQDNGFRTFGMICPSLPFETGPEYPRFARDAYQAIRGERCEHVWAEVINLRGESFTRTMAALRTAGLSKEADMVEKVSKDKAAWETYARETFLAHRTCYEPDTLRFLQYVNASNVAFWRQHKDQGAVLLGEVGLAEYNRETVV